MIGTILCGFPFVLLNLMGLRPRALSYQTSAAVGQSFNQTFRVYIAIPWQRGWLAGYLSVLLRAFSPTGDISINTKTFDFPTGYDWPILSYPFELGTSCTGPVESILRDESCSPPSGSYHFSWPLPRKGGAYLTHCLVWLHLDFKVPFQ